jgi:hypothetical protein
MARRRRGYVNIWCGIPAISGNIHNETLMQISLSLETRGRDTEIKGQREGHTGRYSTVKKEGGIQGDRG